MVRAFRAPKESVGDLNADVAAMLVAAGLMVVALVGVASLPRI